MRKTNRIFAALLLPASALALSACGGQEEEVTYETDVEDLGGGELIVTDADAEGVEVELPETPMTAVPVEEAEAMAEEAPAE